MVTYADPSSCPVCRATLTGPERCEACGFALRSPEATELWSLFTQADRVVARARQVRSAGAHPSPAVPSPTQPAQSHHAYPAQSSQSSQAPAYPVAPVAPAPGPSISAGTILLGLGALLLLVAASIFLTVAWGVLGLAGRALILLVVTAVFFVLARWAERRELRGSAESLWAVFLGLVTLDWFVARGEGLLGLDSLAWSIAALLWSLALVGFAFWRARLVVPQVVAGFSAWVASGLLAIDLLDVADWSAFWALVPPTGYAAAIVALALVRRHVLLAVCASPALAVTTVVLIVAAFAEVVRGDLQVTLLEALPLLLLIATAIALCVAKSMRTFAAGAASLGVQWLALHTATGWSAELGWNRDVGILGLALVVAISAVLGRRPAGEPWWDLASVRVGLRYAAIVGALALALASSEQLDPWWLAALSGLAVATVAWAHRLVPLAWTSAAVGAVLAAGTLANGYPTAPSELEKLLGVLGACVVAVVLARVLRREDLAWGAAAPVLAFAVLTIDVDSGWVWIAVALTLATISLVTLGFQEWTSAVSAGIALPMLAIGVVEDLDGRTTLGDDWLAIVLTAVAAIVVLVVMALDRLPWHRLALEIGAASTFVLAVSGASDSGWAAAHFTIAGVAALVVAFLDDEPQHRRWMRIVGSVALGVAYVLRLRASEVELVEAYTAPFGVIALLVGLVAMRRDPQLRTWTALVPALGLLLLPSLPQALADPTSPRALLLGLLALSFVALGAWRRWGAPLVAGAVVLALVVLVNLGPVAAAVPRWGIIAGAGTGLMIAGLTWEKWVSEGRAVVARLSRMR